MVCFLLIVLRGFIVWDLACFLIVLLVIIFLYIFDWFSLFIVYYAFDVLIVFSFAGVIVCYDACWLFVLIVIVYLAVWFDLFVFGLFIDFGCFGLD